MFSIASKVIVFVIFGSKRIYFLFRVLAVGCAT